ncbi:hypothetical protein [Paraburkholderia bonniea]|uniref:hypothetical protein n=1 Tax=Paraburkholderia bonniea TaxID=2152891 RepID=UPI001291B8F2|nr:hypothetical protein [Paraburkholderia bonniea]
MKTSDEILILALKIEQVLDSQHDAGPNSNAINELTEISHQFQGVCPYCVEKVEELVHAAHIYFSETALKLSPQDQTAVIKTMRTCLAMIRIRTTWWMRCGD